MRKETEPKYLPKVVLARLKTATTLDEVQQLKGQGFTRNEMKAMVRSMGFFDGLEVFLSKWNWDNYASWHLYNWKPQDDETVMKAIYEAEQLHPYSCGRYKNDFAQFEKDWKAETYDPGATLAFEETQVGVLEVGHCVLALGTVSPDVSRVLVFLACITILSLEALLRAGC